MKLEQDHSDAYYQIKAYTAGQVTVNDETLTQSFIVSASVLLPNWEVADVSELTRDRMQPLLALQPEIILLGSGIAFARPDPVLWQQLEAMPLGIEVMDTGAACRTFMALLMEGRRVVAGLIV